MLLCVRSNGPLDAAGIKNTLFRFCIEWLLMAYRAAPWLDSEKVGWKIQ